MTKINNKQEKIAEFKISKSIFIFEIILFIILIYSIFFNKLNIFQTILAIISLLIFTSIDFLKFYKTKIILTNKKIYILDKILKTKNSLDLVKDLQYFRINQNILGKLLNYGTLEFVNMENKIYKIKDIEYPIIFQQLLIEQTNIYLEKLGITEKIGIDNNIYENNNESNINSIEEQSFNEKEKI